jgi:hypothetical protein
VPDYCLKVSAKSSHHALHNISSNPTATFSRIDSNAIEDWINELVLEQKSANISTVSMDFLVHFKELIFYNANKNTHKFSLQKDFYFIKLDSGRKYYFQ